MLKRALFLKGLAASAAAFAVSLSLPAELTVVSPAENAEVCLLTEDQMEFVSMDAMKRRAKMTDAEWRRVLDTNLSGAFYLSRAVVGGMIRNRYGRILHVGSMWGKTGASCEVAYSATKAGLRGLTMSMAKELGPSGITVNCVEPGLIDTDMNASLDDDTKASLCAETPLGRMGTPDEVARAVLFLTSDQAAFITGQILGVDGGMAI